MANSGRVKKLSRECRFALHKPERSPYIGPARDGPAVVFDAGWSSPVARQAHNLKVAGSNPAPATNFPDIT